MSKNWMEINQNVHKLFLKYTVWGIFCVCVCVCVRVYARKGRKKNFAIGRDERAIVWVVGYRAEIESSRSSSSSSSWSPTQSSPSIVVPSKLKCMEREEEWKNVMMICLLLPGKDSWLRKKNVLLWEETEKHKAGRCLGWGALLQSSKRGG